MKFRYFQIVAEASLGEARRGINHALFAAAEPIRLWLLERDVVAPFDKLVMSFADRNTAASWHGHVTIAGGICEVAWAVDPAELRSKSSDHRWVLEHLKGALAAVDSARSWSSPELLSKLDELSAHDMPLIHYFHDLAQSDPTQDVTCLPWLSVRPGETRIGVRITATGRTRDVEVASKLGPMYFETGFPIARTAIRGKEFLFLDGRRKALARVPLQAN
jgi:hypothetical protein